MVELLVGLFALSFEFGNIAMFICGILGCCGELNIALGGAISMIVLGAIFGILPLLKINITKETK